jgi:hypothetical protein
LRAAPDAVDEHRNGGILSHLQGFFFVIRVTDIRFEADEYASDAGIREAPGTRTS